MKSPRNLPSPARSWAPARRLFPLLILVALLLAVCKSVAAQSRPAADLNSAAAEDSLENQPIRSDVPGATGKAAATSESPSTFGATRVVLALAGVIGLIFVLRGGARRLFPGAAPVRASSAVKVLARCPISPKQHLLVIQFGKRLVLVGDTGSHLNPLCEINDPDEAAGILAQARDESITAARRFDSFFGLARKAFSEPSVPAEDRFDDSHEINPVDASADPSAELSSDPSLEATRKELAGLSEKVRDVARQLGSA